MKAVADKRSIFARVDIPALDLIDAHVPARDRPGAGWLYTTLCRVATMEMAAHDRTFEASRKLLMQKASISESTLDKHMAVLERLGLVEVERRGATHGGGLPNRYSLVNPPAPTLPAPPAPLDPKTDPNDYPPVTVTGGVGDTAGSADTPEQPLPGAPGYSMPPLRARHDGVKKKKEEGERERARADQGSDDRETGGAQTNAEREVAAELGALLAGRGEQLSARHRLAIRSALHAAPAGVDAVAAAARIRKHYSAGGKAEHRTIGDVVAVLVAELKQSSPATGDAAPRPRGSSRRRAASYRPMSNAPQPWAIQNPRRLDPPDQHLASAWERARAALAVIAEETQGFGYTWNAYLKPVRLAGVYLTPVSEIDQRDQEQPVIVLDAPDDVVGEVAEKRNMGALVAALERELGEQGIVVELARREASTAGAAAA